MAAAQQAPAVAAAAEAVTVAAAAADSSSSQPPQMAFTARAIADDDEERRWGELCGRGFSHRAGDPARFGRKLRADPQCPREGVRVTLAPCGAFVGSVRVLLRAIDVAGSPTLAAGIAEVCTDPAYRGRGVAAVALPDAMAHCDTRSGAAISLLHAAAAVGALYARYGYAPLRVPYSRLALAGDSGGAALPAGCAVRAADLGDAAEVAALDALHAAATAAMGVTGHTHRPPAYWQRWLPVATAGSAGYLVLEGGGPAAGGRRAPLAFAYVLRKDGVLRAADFGFDPAALAPAHARGFLLWAAASVVARDVAGGGLAADAPEARELLLPARLADALGAGGVAGVDTDDDVGWMVRPCAGQPGGDAACAALAAASRAGRFCVWAADAF